MVCGLWPTDVGHPRRRQCFAVAGIIINEELHWRALRVRADGLLKVAVNLQSVLWELRDNQITLQIMPAEYAIVKKVSAPF